MKKAVLSLLAGCLLLGGGLGSVAWAQAEDEAVELEISPQELRSGLSRRTVERIESLLLEAVEAISRADDAEEVLAGRKKIKAIYDLYEGYHYQSTVTELAARHLVKILHTEEPIKEVNAALALSKMRWVTVQPALEVMVAHENPAVRYLGWRGYQRVRLWVIAQPREFSEKMFASLERAAMNETQKPVIAAVVKMLSIEPQTVPFISQEDFLWARSRALEILRKAWPRYCRLVREGDGEFAEMCRGAMLAVRKIPSPRSERSQKAPVVQLTLDMMGASAEAFSKAPPDSPARRANRGLLIETENALNFITALRKAYLQQALTGGGAEPAPVEQAIGSWLNDLRSAGYEVVAPAPGGAGE